MALLGVEQPSVALFKIACTVDFFHLLAERILLFRIMSKFALLPKSRRTHYEMKEPMISAMRPSGSGFGLLSCTAAQGDEKSAGPLATK